MYYTSSNILCSNAEESWWLSGKEHLTSIRKTQVESLARTQIFSLFVTQGLTNNLPILSLLSL